MMTVHGLDLVNDGIDGVLKEGHRSGSVPIMKYAPTFIMCQKAADSALLALLPLATMMAERMGAARPSSPSAVARDTAITYSEYINSIAASK
eukprot:scaffold8637_cov153-Skeletonema_dohrnii-CCMP3373.AAC.7